jgi:NAD(P)-dependent dehydrogenase (short-subunit alcohol dehydrogenase family)
MAFRFALSVGISWEINVMGRLEGKVAVISGGTSGIGARTAELFVAEGAFVVIAGRRREKGEQLARVLGRKASFIRVDVSIETDVKAMIGHAVARFGRLDCLFNNAGIPSQRASLSNLDLARFDAVMATHVRGTLAGIKYAAPVMATQGSGSIINTASINGFRAGMGGLDYSVSKAAVIHLTRCAAVELGEAGIRVNCLSPGPIATGIFGKGAGLEDDKADLALAAVEAAIAEILPRWQPLPYPGNVDDIAQSALFLASDASRLITGHNLVVDGGISAGLPAAMMRSDLAAFGKVFHAIRQPGEHAETGVFTDAKSTPGPVTR